MRLRSQIAILLALALPVASAVAAAPAVRAPKSGSQYAGSPGDVLLSVSGRSLELMAFSFPCGTASGRTSLNDFPLKRTSAGYRFNADAHGSITYSDGYPDENGEVHMSGRFALNAKTVRGHLRVKSKRCGDTGNLRWRAAVR
ncbi:MAG: hypothetical protein QOE06_912 [Thermoleophilaceae bacterium]|jgi:hypothetical protein|nr:hypothetical protein [Thermoleophilaceae bacterium]